MTKALIKIKEAWDEQPLVVVAAASVALTAVGKVIEAIGSYQSKKAYAKKFGK